MPTRSPFIIYTPEGVAGTGPGLGQLFIVAIRADDVPGLCSEAIYYKIIICRDVATHRKI